LELYCTICELFYVEYYRDFEIWFRGHSRLLKLVPFKSLGAVSYSPIIVTMELSCIVCEILRLIGRKSRNFYTQLVFIASAGDDPVGISWRCLMLTKLVWLRYRMVKKLWEYIKPFSSDTETPRTDGQNCYINIASVCWRAIKMQHKQSSSYRPTDVSRNSAILWDWICFGA